MWWTKGQNILLKLKHYHFAGVYRMRFRTGGWVQRCHGWFSWVMWAEPPPAQKYLDQELGGGPLEKKDPPLRRWRTTSANESITPKVINMYFFLNFKFKQLRGKLSKLSFSECYLCLYCTFVDLTEVVFLKLNLCSVELFGNFVIARLL